MIAWAKSLATTPDYILHGISHANLLLYAQAMPDYSSPTDKDGNENGQQADDKSLRADDPDNNPDKNGTPTRITKKTLWQKTAK